MMEQVFPQIFLWTTMAVYLVQDSIRKMVASRRAQGKEPHAHQIELAAVCDRILAFGHTGNQKVLNKELMAPLFAYWSLLEHGAPTLNTRIVPMETGQLLVNVSRWPILNDGRPAQASTATLTYYFGAKAAQVSVTG
jgi:hypothetical protein